MPEPSRLTASLIERARGGDREAYDRLFALVADRLTLYVRARLGRRLRKVVESLDVLQETYLHAHRDFDRFQDGDDRGLLGWLCRIAENRMRALAEHHGAAKRQPGDAPPLSQVLEAVARSGHGPVTTVVRRERREELARALDQLVDEEREVLLLKYFGGHTLDEIAKLTGHSRSSVNRLLVRAARSLGRALQHLEEEHDARS